MKYLANTYFNGINMKTGQNHLSIYIYMFSDMKYA